MNLKELGAKINALPSDIAAAIAKLNTPTATAPSVTESTLAELRQNFTTLSASVATLQTAVTAAETANATLTADNAKLVTDLAAANAKIPDVKIEAGKKAAEIAAGQGIPPVAAAAAAGEVKTADQLRAEYNTLVAEGKSLEAGQFYQKHFCK